jgi:hypothetical protein
MKSIFNTDNNAELISRINQLTADSRAQWGQMNVAQMMAHCTIAMNMAFGNSKNYRHWVGFFFGDFAKNRNLKGNQLDRNIPAYIKMRIMDDRNFEEEKTKLIAVIQDILIKGEAGLVKYPHPYFRTFKPGEWSQLNWKHLDHHLRQFGV